MTPLEVFEKVEKHLLAQGEQSVSQGGHGDCLYRGPGGLKCAVGCLITDEEYKPEMEDIEVFALTREFDLPLIAQHMDLLSELQTLHDCFLPEHWRSMLNDMRKRVQAGDFDVS